MANCGVPSIARTTFFTAHITVKSHARFFFFLEVHTFFSHFVFCHHHAATNAIELEKEQYLALADKVKATDIEKLSKQKMHLPTSVMDLVWMVQNFHAVISLCFGPN
jgi:hypothetical protein